MRKAARLVTGGRGHQITHFMGHVINYFSYNAAASIVGTFGSTFVSRMVKMIIFRIDGLIGKNTYCLIVTQHIKS
jgi:hypothetical protein